MKLIYLIVFLFLLFIFSSKLSKTVCLETKEGISKIHANKLELQFKHSLYGGMVGLSANVAGDKIMVRRIFSNDEASISYYTDEYIFRDGQFVAEIRDKMDVLLVNDGWKLRFGDKEIVTENLTKIYVCR